MVCVYMYEGKEEGGRNEEKEREGGEKRGDMTWILPMTLEINELLKLQFCLPENLGINVQQKAVENKYVSVFNTI